MANDDAPLFIKIDVNNNDIANAYFARRSVNGLRNGGWSGNCPVSQAVKRQLGVEVSTGFEVVSVNGVGYAANAAVKEYIKNVDATIQESTAHVKPQTFYLKRI